MVKIFPEICKCGSVMSVRPRLNTEVGNCCSAVFPITLNFWKLALEKSIQTNQLRCPSCSSKETDPSYTRQITVIVSVKPVFSFLFPLSLTHKLTYIYICVYIYTTVSSNILICAICHLCHPQPTTTTSSLFPSKKQAPLCIFKRTHSS